MIKIGILGGGTGGASAIDAIRKLPVFRLIGIYDPDPDLRESFYRETGLQTFENAEMLTEVADAIDITGPLHRYPSTFRQAVKDSKHVFLHNPFTEHLQSAREMLKLAGESRGIVQVSQPNRYNPAFMAAFPYIRHPRYIEIHRKIPFGQAGSNTSLVLQYLMHDIDLAIFVNRSDVRKSSISGVSLVSTRPDLVEARLEFRNGCVANFMINRVSREASHTCHFYQAGMTIRLDLLKQTAELQHLRQPGVNEKDHPGPHITTEQLLVTPSDPLAEEMASFHTSISDRAFPQVNLDDAFRAMELSLELQDRLNWMSSN